MITTLLTKDKSTIKNSNLFMCKQISKRYKIVNLIDINDLFKIYTGIDLLNGQKVTIKILKMAKIRDRHEDIILFHHKINIIAKLFHPNLIKIHEIGVYEGLNYIVTEKINGVDLSRYLKKAGFLQVEEAVSIFKQITTALDFVHRANVICRYLKPGNIMIISNKTNNHNPHVKLSEFGLSGIIDLTQIKEEKEIIETFSYMSPEQGGIIKNSIDERSDLYSLGIIFYQLLTGELPFKGNIIGTILYQHIAKIPVPPHKIRNQIPLAIEEIILRLLKKDPKERYQTAQELLIDINQYLKGGKLFILGEKHRFPSISFQTHLIGRDREINRLKTLINYAGVGKGHLCLLSGEAGVGKTRLVDELREYIYEKGGIFISSKCVDQENKLPYQPFTEALNEFFNYIEKLPEEERARIIIKIKDIVGDLGELTCQLNPVMKKILGDVPKPSPLEGVKEKIRFLMTCSKLFKDLGEEKRPLVLTLDNLQWADEGSLLLLQKIICEIEKNFVLIIGTFRDTEVGPNHLLNQIINDAQEKPFSFEWIAIKRLDLIKTNQMLNGLLLEDKRSTYHLTQYIYKKSRGNPLFIIEILRHLIIEKVLIYQKEYWEINWEKIEKVTIPVNIIDIILKRIKNLNTDLLSLLSLAAVIGREFNIELLFCLSDQPKERAFHLIVEGISLQLLEKGIRKGSLLFVHDRIKDAFYQMIGEDKRKALHLKIAHKLETLYQKNKDKVIFDIAHHYSKSGNKHKFLEFALPAADKAKEKHAIEDAIRFYTSVTNLLDKTGYKSGSPEWMRANEGLIDVYLISGKTDKAIETGKNLIPFLKTLLEKAQIYRKIGTAYLKKADYSECENHLITGLTLLGEKVPQKKAHIYFYIIKELCRHIVQTTFRKIFRPPKNKMVKPEDIEISRIYQPLGWMYILTNIDKFIWNILRLLNFTQAKIGNSVELGVALGGYASLYMAIPCFKRSIRYHKKALYLRRTLKDEWGVAQSLQWLGYCYSWMGDYQKSTEIFSHSKKQFLKIGDLWELGMVLLGTGTNYLYLGEFNKSIEVLSNYFSISKQINDDYGLLASQSLMSQVFIEKGNFEKAEKLGEKIIFLSKKYKKWYMICISNMRLGYLELEKGHYEKAIGYLKKAKEVYESHTLLKQYTLLLYPLLADALIERFKIMGGKIKAKELREVCLETLKKTKPWPTYYGMALRVMAKYYALVKKEKKAERYFLKSIEHTKRFQRKYELAKSYFEYGNFLQSIGKEEIGRENWIESNTIFKEISAEIYIRRTENVLGIKNKITKEISQEKLIKKLELDTIFSVIHCLSTIHDLDLLLEMVMDAAINITGAERGFLLLYPEKNSRTDTFIKDLKRDMEKKGGFIKSPITNEYYEIKVFRNIDNDIFSQEGFPIDYSIIQKVNESHETVMLSDAGFEGKLGITPGIQENGLRSILCVPLLLRENFLGIIYLDSRLVGGLFNEEKIELLKILCIQAAISIENARFYKAVKEKTKLEREFEISQRLINIGKIATEVAHELKNPLGNIINIKHWFNQYIESDHPANQCLEALSQEANRMNKLCQQMLHFSRYVKDTKCLININSIIEDTLLFLSGTFYKNKISVEKNLNNTIRESYINADQIRQVFINIFMNSIEAMERGGTLRIETMLKNDHIEINISDTGVGIPKEIKDKIFQCFFTTKKDKGIGIGLSICFEIIRKHGGNIYVESELGKGSTFKIILPISNMKYLKYSSQLVSPEAVA